MENKEIVWRGKPRQGLQFAAGDIVFIPFLFLFGLILIFLAMFINNDTISFIFISIFMCVLYFRYVHDMVSRKATTYTIADKEVIINSKTKHLNLAFSAIANVYLEENTGNSTYGSIIFERNAGDLESHREYMGTYAAILPPKERVEIADIKDYKRVYSLIKTKIGESSHVNKK